MYDCSKEFNKFYRTEVVLPAKEQNELRQKRKLNIKRLKDGLLEYNDEKKKLVGVAHPDPIRFSQIIKSLKKESKAVWPCTLLLKMMKMIMI